MPLIQQFVTRALAAGPGTVFQDASMGALTEAIGGGLMHSSMEAARSSGEKSINKIQGDPSAFACGAVRAAMEHTPVFGSVFRLGEAAVGRRICDTDDMTTAERQSLARGAVVDAVAPGASLVMSALETGASPQARPMLESMIPGVTQSAGYKSVASVLRADDPDRETQISAAKAAAVEEKAKENAADAVATLTAIDTSRLKPPTPSNKGVSDEPVPDAEPVPAYASSDSISSKLSARRAAAALTFSDNDPDQPNPVRSAPRFGARM